MMLFWLSTVLAAPVICSGNTVYAVQDGRRTYLPGVTCPEIANTEGEFETMAYGAKLVIPPTVKKAGRVVFFEPYKKNTLLFGLSYQITNAEALKQARQGNRGYFIPKPTPTSAKTVEP